MAATIVTLMTVDVTVTALPMPLSASGPTLPRIEHDQRRQGNRDDGGDDREDRRLGQGHEGEVRRGSAARSHEREVRSPTLEQHARHQHDRVAGEDSELDRQQRDPAVTDEDRPFDFPERRREHGRDPRGSPTDRRAGPTGKTSDALAEVADLVRREAPQIRHRPPFERERPIRGRRQERIAAHDERAPRREPPRRLGPVQLERRRQPVRIGPIGDPDPGDHYPDA